MITAARKSLTSLPFSWLKGNRTVIHSGYDWESCIFICWVEMPLVTTYCLVVNTWDLTPGNMSPWKTVGGHILIKPTVMWQESCSLFFFKHLYWSIIALQWCVSFCFITKWISYTHTYIPISPPSCISLPSSLSHPSRWSQITELISLCYAAASH